MSSLAVKPLAFSLTPRLIREMVRIGLDRAPCESCGVILPEPGDTFRKSGIGARVIELPNRSLQPQDSYELHGSDILVELQHWFESVSQEERDKIVIWHTHPSGDMGPSRRDLEHKLHGLSYLAVSLDIANKTGQATLF